MCGRHGRNMAMACRAGEQPRARCFVRGVCVFRQPLCAGEGVSQITVAACALRAVNAGHASVCFGAGIDIAGMLGPLAQALLPRTGAASLWMRFAHMMLYPRVVPFGSACARAAPTASCTAVSEAAGRGPGGSTCQPRWASQCNATWCSA